MDVSGVFDSDDIKMTTASGFYLMDSYVEPLNTKFQQCEYCKSKVSLEMIRCESCGAMVPMVESQ